MTGDPPVTLASLAARWGQAYLFGYARDRWIAIRRDGIWFLAAATLATLEAEIGFDQEQTPLLAVEDPVSLARDYLATGRPATGPAPGETAAIIAAAEAILRSPGADQGSNGPAAGNTGIAGK